MNEVQGKDSFLLSTLTLAQPAGTSCLIIISLRNNREAAEFLPCKILAVCFTLATAALSVTTDKARGKDGFLLTTLTLAKPAAAPILIVSLRENREASEFLPCQVLCYATVLAAPTAFSVTANQA